MNNYTGSYKPTKTTEYLINLNKFVFIFGLPNFWVEDLDFSNAFKKIIRQLSTFGNLAIYAMILSEYVAFITQKNLTERQRSYLFICVISESIYTGFRVRMTHQEGEIRDVMYKLGIELKEIYNDGQAEQQMINRSKFFSWAFILISFMTIVMYTIQGVIRVLRTGETFNAIIIAWPDIEDRSTISNIVRIIFYTIWWICLTRSSAVYSLVISLIIAVSHQFKNLNSYFQSLTVIFEDDLLTQDEKEQNYERALKVGIKMHSETLKCTRKIQVICRDVFNGQIIFNLTLLIVLMYQMVNSPRTLMNALTLMIMALAILCSTGFLMCNAGDITVQAEILPTAMYCSGWENCRRMSSVRVRKLLVIAMQQAQEPVVLTGFFGIIPLSYQSYVSIVKASYSVFSVLY